MNQLYCTLEVFFFFTKLKYVGNNYIKIVYNCTDNRVILYSVLAISSGFRVSIPYVLGIS